MTTETAPKFTPTDAQVKWAMHVTGKAWSVFIKTDPDGFGLTANLDEAMSPERFAVLVRAIIHSAQNPEAERLLGECGVD